VKIFYGICGEGMGHGGRSIALIERLVGLRHQVTLFTFADAFALLTRSGYHPHRIAGLQWVSTKTGGIAGLRSLGNLACYLRRRRDSLDFIRQLALADRPDLFITDFEPLTALAAHSLKIPCVSVDNQHRFCHPLGREFPRRLRIYGRLAGQFVRRWIHKPRQCIVAVFHPCPPNPRYQRVEALLRDRLAQLRPTQGSHVLLYGRGELGRRIARVASTLAERFVAYGCEGVAAENIEYKATSYEGFTRDLASCKAVLSTAGQQLIGEAQYLGKPLLVVPIPRQHEQEINAHYARLQGIGDFCPIECLTGDRIRAFLEQRFVGRSAVNGVDQVIELLEIGHG
jgi:uncharacterized protein (TIGR00661 family)